MTPNDLRRIGEAFYGPRWQTSLAVALGVADRTVRSWLSGRRSLPVGLATDLARLGKLREAEIQAATAALPP